MRGQSGGFTTVYADYSRGQVFLDLTDVFAARGNSLQFVATAMNTGGTYTDDWGQVARLGMPLESTEATLFELRLSADGFTVEIYRPQLGLRTSDPQASEALRRGAGSGWAGGFPVLVCSEDEGAWYPLQEEPSAKHGGRIVIDGATLIDYGFVVAPDAGMQAESYRLLSARSFPTNLDVTVEYMTAEPRSAVEVGFSMILLPAEPMIPRASDDRLLYFTTDYKDLGQRFPIAQQLSSEAVDRKVSMIWRYDLGRQPGGEIRIHVDPTVPVRWRQRVREGIEAWNVAFASIGAPNAVRAILPGDPDWPKDYDLNDARFSTVSWSVSDEVSSIGVAKVDPRSGEILKGDIIMSDGWVQTWLSDLDHFAPNATRRNSQGARPGAGREGEDGEAMERRREANEMRRVKLALLGQAAGTSNPEKRKELVGEGLRSVVMHETGHILGLRHNFKGSLGVSYECTQDISCSAVHGLSASVMDYLPMNLPAEPGRKVHAFSPVIGAYDKLAIAYGYSRLENEDRNRTGNISRTAWTGEVPEELLPVLAQAEAFETCYDDDEYAEDPSCLPYDFTSDPVSFSQAQLSLFADVQRHLLNMSVSPGEPYLRYGAAAEELLWRAQGVASDLLLWVGGVNTSYVHLGLDGARGRVARQPVPASKQRKALDVFLRVLRPERAGLLPTIDDTPFLVWPAYVKGAGHVSSLNVAQHAREMTRDLVSQALSSFRVMQVYDSQTHVVTEGAEPPLRCEDYLSELTAGIVGDGVDVPDKPADWHLHKDLVTNLKALFLDKDVPDEVASNALFHLVHLSAAVEAAHERLGDGVTWRRCAAEGGDCACSGLVRFGLDHHWSPALAAKGTARCDANRFLDPPTPVSLNRCECLAAAPEGSDVFRAHLQTLRSELAEVICSDEDVHCKRSSRGAGPDPLTELQDW